MTPNEIRGVTPQAIGALRQGGKIGPIQTRNGPVEVTILDLGEYRADLLPEVTSALLALATGHAVTVAVSYRKQTKTKPRIEGQDYEALPGVGHEALMGALSCFRTKAGALRLTVLTPFRALNGESGWATLIPAGITGFKLTTTAPAPVAQAPTGGPA